MKNDKPLHKGQIVIEIDINRKGEPRRGLVTKIGRKWALITFNGNAFNTEQVDAITLKWKSNYSNKVFYTEETFEAKLCSDKLKSDLLELERFQHKLSPPQVKALSAFIEAVLEEIKG